MGTDELRKRENWQSESGDRALKAEDIFYNVFKEAFKSSDFEVVVKPTDLNNIYKKIKLDETVLQTIFQPAQDYGKHGVAPDFAIRNNATGKTLYIEVKRQDGWVEGKKPSAGRGNAHERLCKYFTPGLLNKMRTTSNITSSDLPFWVIFVGLFFEHFVAFFFVGLTIIVTTSSYGKIRMMGLLLLIILMKK